MNSKPSIVSATDAALRDFLDTCGEPSFRIKQLKKWCFATPVLSWQDMNNIPKAFQEELARKWRLFSLEKKDRHVSSIDESEKYVFATNDRHYIETVLIRKGKRRTVCVSTQIGCKFSCKFCASGADGFLRDLKSSEIVDQVRYVQAQTKEIISNIVLMGMGEPLDNYENTLDALRILTDKTRMGFPQRHITVSTVGIIPALEQFAESSFRSVKLSISLHAPTDKKRRQIMPIAKKYSVDELVKTLLFVSKKCTRTLTLEYIMLKDFNDTKEDAQLLSQIARKLRAKINLIAYNQAQMKKEFIPRQRDIKLFADLLKKNNALVTIRKSAGPDIMAACGQLAAHRRDSR